MPAAASPEVAAGVGGVLGRRLDEGPLDGPRRAETEAPAPLFEAREPNVTQENIQSQLRGVTLMALSNKFGEMTTGNKSGVAAGHAAIYGSMAAGYNPIKDLYKTRAWPGAAAGATPITGPG